MTGGFRRTRSRLFTFFKMWPGKPKLVKLLQGQPGLVATLLLPQQAPLCWNGIRWLEKGCTRCLGHPTLGVLIKRQVNPAEIPNVCINTLNARSDNEQVNQGVPGTTRFNMQVLPLLILHKQ
jgi:hypothetical protein